MTGAPGTDAYDPISQGILTSQNPQNWASDMTVPAGQVMAIASGQDYLCGNMTVNGTLINAGTLRCKSFTTGAGGVYIAEAGSKKEIYSKY
jgi:hypothetical protein